MNKKIFKNLYIINLSLIIIALLIPLFIKLFNSSYNDTSLLYYAIFTLLGVSLCISFLGINIWALFLYKKQWYIYSIVIILMAVWIILGVNKFSANVFP
jgi:hypothetical protein